MKDAIMLMQLDLFQLLGMLFQKTKQNKKDQNFPEQKSQNFSSGSCQKYKISILSEKQ